MAITGWKQHSQQIKEVRSSTEDDIGNNLAEIGPGLIAAQERAALACETLLNSATLNILEGISLLRLRCHEALLECLNPSFG